MSIRSQRPKGLGANLLLSLVGWFLLFTVSPAVAQTDRATLFGPDTFVRGKGKPTTETRSFNLNGFRPPFTLHLQNGSHRVSSARVWLNGQLLFGPSAFSQQVAGYDVLVDLTNPSTLQVSLASKPGSELTLWVEGVPNAPPVADAGPDQSSGVLVGDAVLLDGSASSDPDGDALTYSWSLMVVPPGSTAELSDPTAVDPSFVADEPGTYTVWLTVNDGFVDSAVDDVSITVVIPPPKVTITTPENLSVVTASPVTVTGTVDDPNATLTVNGVPVANTNGTYTADVALQEGSNTVTVVGQNSTGEGQDSVEVVLNTADNPAVSITSPKSNFIIGKEFAMGVAFPPQINASVAGGIKVNTTGLNNKPIVTVNSVPADVTLNLFFSNCGLFNPLQCWKFDATIPLAQGNRTITAVGTDKLNRSTTVSIDGVVDYCRIEDKDLSVFALAGPNHDIQGNRCHEIDGCSVPVVGSFANDPLPLAVCKIASTKFGEGTSPPSEHFVHGLQSAFSLPCNHHDVCYQTCVPVAGLSEDAKEQAWEDAWHACNLRQFEEMKAVCRRAYPGVCPVASLSLSCVLSGGCVRFLREKKRCFARAVEYTLGVESPPGLTAFKERQQDYCAN